MNFQPIARTKITPTPVGSTTLSRPRLLDWLGRNVHRRVLAITAEAGYGKTSLIADFSRLGLVRCLWYKLDRTDRDWVTFANYVVAAVREVEPEFGRATLALLERMAIQAPEREVVVGTLVAEISAVVGPATVFVLDDYHHIDANADVQDVLERLIASAPRAWCFALVGRRRPRFPLGRLAVQGELAELDTQDLRFSVEETERLFRDAYEHPLEPDLIERIEVRTEGWVASLQLLDSSIRGRSAAEIRRFVDALSGSQGPLYDFLAQELLTGLTPALRRFLAHASLLERVTPTLVAVVLRADPQPEDVAEVQRLIAEAEGLGLLPRQGESSASRRFHPLLREFLLAQLRRSTGEQELRDLHRRVAMAVEPSDWLTACDHFIDAGEPVEAMRVLGDSVLVALGTGQWGAAAALVERLDGVEPRPEVAAIAALRQIYAGRPEAALQDLVRIDSMRLRPLARAAIRHGLYRAYWSLGDEASVLRVIRDVLNDRDSPEAFREIAAVHQVAIAEPVHLPAAAAALEDLASRQAGAGMPFFQGISLHNAMTVRLHEGNYLAAQRDGELALATLDSIEIATTETPATHATLARVLSELGEWAQAEEHLAKASASEVSDPDALAEAAYVAIVSGRLGMASSLLERAGRLIVLASRPGLSARSTWHAHQALLLRAQGRPDIALSHLQAAPAPWGIGAALAFRAQAALAASSFESTEVKEHLPRAIADAEQRGSTHWLARLRVALAASQRDPANLHQAMDEAGSLGALSLPEVAEILVPNLHVVGPLPASLQHSLRLLPRRWLPTLRRELEHGRTLAGPAVIDVLAAFGEAEDGPRIRAYERTYLRAKRAQGLAKKLARRVSPVLTVHDLGRTWLAIGDRRVNVAQMRRKAATLLVYLVSRRNRVATRDQVLEALWPDLSPSGASNSLNQTLYFLRRDIDPWYDEHLSMDYVHAESETVWLDEEKVLVDGAKFEAFAADFYVRDSMESAHAALELYTGTFCVEFQYEDWSVATRDRLHALFLHLVHAVHARLVAERRYDIAAEITRRAIGIDPEAIELERTLIWLYSAMGARSAAGEQWNHYASSYRDLNGTEPPSLQEIASGSAA